MIRRVPLFSGGGCSRSIGPAEGLNRSVESPNTAPEAVSGALRREFGVCGEGLPAQNSFLSSPADGGLDCTMATFRMTLARWWGASPHNCGANSRCQI